MSKKRKHNMRDAITNTGKSIFEFSDNQRVMLVFLRHFGCTFCRETLSDLSQQKDKIDAQGVQIILVHMVEEEEARKVLESYNVDEFPRISDPEMGLYESWGLEKGTISQLFGLKVWWRGITVGAMGGHGIGWLKGNGFQMPGVFLIEKRNIVDQFIHKSAADRPNYWEMSCCD